MVPYFNKDPTVTIIFMTILFFRDDIKCVCPDGHNYLDTKYDFKMEGMDAIVEIEYFCLPVGGILTKIHSFNTLYLSYPPVIHLSTARTSPPSQESTLLTPSVSVHMVRLAPPSLTGGLKLLGETYLSVFQENR